MLRRSSSLKEKKCKQGGFSRERDTERVLNKQEPRGGRVGGFKLVGKVVEVHVRRTFAALGLTCVQGKPIFYTFSYITAEEWGDSIMQKEDFQWFVTDMEEH